VLAATVEQIRATADAVSRFAERRREHEGAARRLLVPLEYARCGNQRNEKAMTFQAGDRVVAESESTERPARYGTVQEVVHEDPHARYRIEWDDGRTSVYTPAAGALKLAPETAKRAG
jgi:hypothetical protein